MIKVLYTVFLGFIITIFIAMGINAFYPAPKYPDSPMPLYAPAAAPSSLEITEDMRLEEQNNFYKQQSDDYEAARQHHSRNLSLITIGFAILLMLLGIVLEGKISILPHSLLLSSIFMLIYSISTSLMVSDPRYSFAIATCALVITLGIGYVTFIRPSAAKH